MSVAISQVFSSVMSGRCRDRPELVNVPMVLKARLDVLPVRGGEGFLQSIFEPLGYSVEATRHPLGLQICGLLEDSKRDLHRLPIQRHGLLVIAHREIQLC